jgi:hypothetical protein
MSSCSYGGDELAHSENNSYKRHWAAYNVLTRLLLSYHYGICVVRIGATRVKNLRGGLQPSYQNL